MTREQLYREVVRERFGPPPVHEARAKPSPAPRPAGPPGRGRLRESGRRCGLGPEQIKALLRLPAGRAAQILAVREARR